MPATSKFGFNVLVDSKELPEYTHPEDSSRVMVESILVSPVTYWLTVREYSSYSQQIEEQKKPVTPYTIKVFTHQGCPKSLFKVYVDGIKVKEVWLGVGKSEIIEGFPEKDGSSREFLFSLPRFAEDEKDRVESTRSLRVGKIEVVRHDVTFAHSAMGFHQNRYEKFVQANKKDVANITKLKYTMTTTSQGKLIRNSKPYEKCADTKPEKKLINYYNIGDEVGKIELEYHMTHTLLDWGIQPTRLDWSS